MYLKTQGASKHIIKDLYEVWLPPVPERHLIINHELKRSDQFWRRSALPKYYDERRGEEAYQQAKEKELVDDGIIPKVKHFDPALERYRRNEWARRINGVWFMNDGEPTYLTGTHYYYLQWCKLDHEENEGYPLFYQPQLDRFYFRELCMEDPFSLGYLFVGPRGGGKSSEEVACQLENITRPGHNRHAAIQSKTEEDARIVVFQEKMVPMFNNMPDFFKPEYSHGTEPKEKMVFRRSSIRGKEAKKVKHGPDFELGNTVMVYPPFNKAIDGKTLSDVINDEIGKLKPEANMDAYTRNTTNVKTVFRNQRKRGIIRATTTVEEMDHGGDECYEIWQESDPRVRDGNGYTISKLYRFFISAMETQTHLADKHGRIAHDIAYAAIMNEREPVKDDNIKLSSLMRKNPTTEEEAFIKNQADCIYDVMILSKRIAELELLKPAVRPGRTFMIEWVKGQIDGDVELVPHPDGPLRLFYDPDLFWNKQRKLLNACESYINSKTDKRVWLPCNNDFFRASTDPIKFVKTSDPRASKMAAHGMMKFIPDLDFGKDLKDWISHNILWEYCYRHSDPELDYENIIKLIRYFGHSIMPEANAGEFVKHLVGRGYHKFIIQRKNFNADVLLNKYSKNKMSGENAVHNNVEVIESYVKRTAANIRRHGHRINSLPLLKQLRAFDPKNQTKFDLAVSYGYGILALEADLEDTYNNQKEDESPINYFARYDISGNQSRLLQTISQNNTSDEVSDFDDPNYIYALLNRT